MYHLLTGLYAEWTKKERFNILVVGLAGVGKSCLVEKIKSIYLRTPALPPSRIAPTVGQNVFDLTLPSSHLHFWDLGGSASVRSLWQKYYEESHALVWVVDARDWIGCDDDDDEGGTKDKGKAVQTPEDVERQTRREESWTTLASLLDHPSLEGLPILILANKVDACSATSDSTASQNEAVAVARRIKRWIGRRMADVAAADTTTAAAEYQNGQDHVGIPHAQAPAAGYEWDVVATSALDGTGVSDAVDWLYLRVQNVKR
ncbi:uncharacterized protein PFL1_02442 [Pseudozyma flocculosa PF-1]|uniref:Related to ARL3 - ADP-ribosylation factor-like protein, member of the arf-sar family in the ras superfamily n=2 Tax=Pseudozyma flocculosa TaxID=84751 RepID=A0A5C3EZ43_9BASI|nr:uncharacterized protein PFL1_02442 [Pseudozyma flocculosa PF-1]EPQ29769.1 hypothetical protein PFL1_02442 [Pseudozyma flocculosa PF-1]SPO37055.1 related to ARL3 - ADP-ribosylation factor-like protein, member of the arf-sar family in the ras superfamily [Pseudozyma flocculosa]